jgi:hypothetical protein
MTVATMMRTVMEPIPSAIKLQSSVMEFVKEANVQSIIDTMFTNICNITQELLIVCLDYIVMALIAKDEKQR